MHFRLNFISLPVEINLTHCSYWNEIFLPHFNDQKCHQEKTKSGDIFKKQVTVLNARRAKSLWKQKMETQADFIVTSKKNTAKITLSILKKPTTLFFLLLRRNNEPWSKCLKQSPNMTKTIPFKNSLTLQCWITFALIWHPFQQSKQEVSRNCLTLQTLNWAFITEKHIQESFQFGQEKFKLEWRA